MALALAGTMLVVLSSALATPTGHARRPTRPVIDVGYLYRQLYFTATHYHYRVSGEGDSPELWRSG